MIVLSCKDICKSYGIRDILKNITFSINEGDKVGVIGPNGEGKSTLFKIITKELSQDSGEVFIDKTSNLGYLSQNLSLDSSKTIYEETLSVFEELLNIENRLATLEVKMNEPYDASNAAYHDKLIQDYTTFQDIYSHKGGYIYKGEISRVLNGLGFVEELFDKKIEGFGEIFRHQSFLEIGSGALISRATAGVYKKTVIFSMPGSPNAVKTASNIIIDEFPHLVFHAKK